MRKNCTFSVNLSDDLQTATIRMSGCSAPLVVNCLGVEADSKGNPSRIYLNACFHHTNKAEHYFGWRPYGAITTILERIPEVNP